MRKWGLVVSFFFAAVVLVLLVPAGLVLAWSSTPTAADFGNLYRAWGTWVCAGVVIAGGILLLWLKVDTTQKRLKPRTHLLVSVFTTALLMAILTLSIIAAILVGVRGDDVFKLLPEPDSAASAALPVAFAIPWLIWGILFYRLWRDSDDPITHAVRWLFRGSVLELLIAVPAHVIVRRRHDCSAPAVTSFGITSGIAIMLISFGPGVLLLYKKRMEKYARTPAGK